MKGLITKDMLIIRNQWKTVSMVILIGIFLTITNGPGGIIVYFPTIISMVILGTLSYDEMDNGYSYLFTLPISRKNYVREKYLFSFIATITTIVISIITCIIIMMLSSEPPVIYWDEILDTSAIVFTFLILLFAVEIPLRLKYGVEKGKITLYALFGILAIGAILISRFFPENKAADIRSYLQMGSATIAGSTMIASIASVVILCLSSVLSTKILNEKEF